MFNNNNKRKSKIKGRIKSCIYPSKTLLTMACFGRLSILQSSCESLRAAARTRRVDFWPSLSRKKL